MKNKKLISTLFLTGMLSFTIQATPERAAKPDISWGDCTGGGFYQLIWYGTGDFTINYFDANMRWLECQGLCGDSIISAARQVD